MLEIVADVHEQASGIPVMLRHLGAAVTVCNLPRADYLSGDCAIERKSVPDLHLTAMRGRYWRQLHKLRGVARWSYLLVEGRSLWRGDGLAREPLRGLLMASADLGVCVIRSEDPVDSAAWILRISNRDGRPSRNRPVYAQRPQRDPHIPAPEQALSAASGVSAVTARALLAHFGSLRSVISASVDELQAVPGVGPVKAEELVSMFHAQWPGSQPV